MSAYSAVIGDAASVGLQTLLGDPTMQSNDGSATNRRNPQLATARIRTIQDPHTVQDAVGGMISADFTVPCEEALRWRPVLRYGNVCWLFDGETPIFVGWLEQPVWTQTGDAQITLSGPWVLLGRARMREIWEDYDLSQFNPIDPSAGHLNNNGQVNLTSANRLKIVWPNNTTLANSDRIGVDYFAFGEAAAPTDDKLLTAFEFDIIDNNFAGNVNMTFRVLGVSSPTSGTGDLLYSTTSAGSSDRQGALNLHGTNQSGQWVNVDGYRCLKFQLLYSGAAGSLGVDRYVVLDRIRVSTRESLFPAVAGNIDTGAIARDVLAFNLGGAGVFPASFQTGLPQEFWYSGGLDNAPDSSTFKYLGGLDPRTGTGSAQNTGISANGFNAVAWQSPAEILASLAALDGAHVGFYIPYNGRGGYDAPGMVRTPLYTFQDVGSWWLTAPPQLTYQLFTDPTTSPDYTIHTREGAQVVQDPNAQPLIDTLYVNYQQNSGRQASVIVTDESNQNYAAAQGYRRSEDYTLQGSSGAALASSQGSQYLTQRRQPNAAATITIQNDGSARYPILKQGAVIPHLSLVRPGSVRVVDVSAASGLRAGYATHVEWWGQTLGSNERIELTLGQPGQVDAHRLQGMIVNRYKRTRRGPFSRGAGF